MRMSTPERYDAIVIGGQAGGPLAPALARSGRRTALTEREHLGGSCINEGCTPAKTMVASARVAYLARRAAGYGVGTGPIAVDLGRVRERKRANVKSFRALRRIGPADGLEWAGVAAHLLRRFQNHTYQPVTGRACMHHRPALTVRGTHRPPLGRIVPNEKDARRQGRAYLVARMPMNARVLTARGRRYA
jgi:hypothetical protein